MRCWRPILILLCAIAIFVDIAVAQAPNKRQQVTIMGSEVHSLISKDTGRSYDLYVHRPNSPAAGKKYPVIYVLDGQWDFKLYDSVNGGLFYDKMVPEMIIIGITYSGSSPDYGKLRAMDYTPAPRTDLPGSGDAVRFLAFLKKDVFPFAEASFNADPSKRILSGNSLGGLFTLWVLFTEPSLFMGYIASSPAVSYSDNYLFEHEKKFFEARKELPVRVYITVGGKEGLREPVSKFMQAIRGHDYKQLKLETHIMETEGHTSNKPETYTRGLRFMFSE